MKREVTATTGAGDAFGNALGSSLAYEFGQTSGNFAAIPGEAALNRAEAGASTFDYSIASGSGGGQGLRVGGGEGLTIETEGVISETEGVRSFIIVR